MKKRIAIVQSNYIPWKGYFDLINSVDEFVIYDDVQFTRRDWRNRNRIKTVTGSKWITIPVEVKGKYRQKISETRIADKTWSEKHWAIIRNNYKTAPYFNNYSGFFENAYKQCGELEYLSDVNKLFIQLINYLLGIKTTITDSSSYRLSGDKNEKLISICVQAGADNYFSGPSAKTYINTELFTEAGISLTWIDYSGYPDYLQSFPPFDHNVSIIDLLFNCGEGSVKKMKSF